MEIVLSKGIVVYTPPKNPVTFRVFIIPFPKSRRLFRLFTALPLIPADERPTLPPKEIFDWENESVEITTDKMSKICFFILWLEAGFFKPFCIMRKENVLKD